MISTLLDWVLAIALLALAWASLTSAGSRRAVVLFIAFGLLLALVWVRLQAPDVALAEAAIGAGLTGALLLSALRDEPDVSAVEGEAVPQEPRPAGRNGLLTVLSIALAAVVGWAFVYALGHGEPKGLAEEVFANLEVSGVSNPVTAVLLNFRAYDTLLELAVLLAAMLGIVSLGPARRGYSASGPVFSGLVRWVVPALILMSGYLLWIGAHAPGGAFQAGALLASAGVLLHLSGDTNGGLPHGTRLRGATVVGVAVFLTIGLTAMLAGQPFLGYPVAWAGSLILVIESAAMLAIAATLVIAYQGGEPGRWTSSRQAKGGGGLSQQTKSIVGGAADDR